MAPSAAQVVRVISFRTKVALGNQSDDGVDPMCPAARKLKPDPSDPVSTRLASVRETLNELDGALTRSVHTLAALQVSFGTEDDALRASAMLFAAQTGARRTNLRLID